jgi:hypothetical protein
MSDIPAVPGADRTRDALMPAAGRRAFEDPLPELPELPE